MDRAAILSFIQKVCIVFVVYCLLWEICEELKKRERGGDDQAKADGEVTV